jgi:hypothetical protein
MKPIDIYEIVNNPDTNPFEHYSPDGVHANPTPDEITAGIELSTQWLQSLKVSYEKPEFEDNRFGELDET